MPHEGCLSESVRYKSRVRENAVIQAGEISLFRYFLPQGNQTKKC